LEQLLVSSLRRRARAVTAAVGAAAIGVTGLVYTASANAQDSAAPVVISQVYGGGGNSGAFYTHDFVELLNRSDEAVDLAGWSVQYASAAGTSWQVTQLDGVIEPGGYFLVAQAAGTGGTAPLPDPDTQGSIAMAAANGKVALAARTTALSGACPLGDTVDFAGFGTANCFEGTGAISALSNPVSGARLDFGCRDTDDNADDFELLNPPAPRNSASDTVDCGDLPEPVDPDFELTCPTFPASGVDVSTVAGYGVDRAVTADADVASWSVTTDAAGVTIGADGPGSAVLTVAADAPAGLHAATVTATDADGGTASCDIAVEVTAIINIGAVQGVIADDATSFTSPFLGQRVAVTGVVTQLLREGSGSRGFMLQERADATDGDDRSSDGIYVFNSNFTDLRTDSGSPAADTLGARWDVAVGDEIVLRGTVADYFGMTQFAGGSSFVWDVTDAGLDPASTVAVTEIDAPSDWLASQRYFRRHLGMQMTVPADSVVTAGRDVFGTDGEVWAIRGDSEIAERGGYSGRVFRDAHPLDNNPGSAFDDGNGYRFVIGSFGIKGAADDPNAIIAPAKTFDVITETATGGVMLSFGKYTVNVAENLELEGGLEPALNNPAVAADRDRAAQIAAYNVENLYDFRDSPDSGCDFIGNTGCREGSSTVNPPFNYAPEDLESYETQLARIADQIMLDLHNPDVIMVQEAEKQDVCSVNPAWTPEAGLGADRLVCDLETAGAGNAHRDGRPDVLQELALVIAERGGPAYDAAFDADAGDLRGITTGFLYRSDRVELLDAAADHPVLGAGPAVGYGAEPLAYNADVQNPKALNAKLPDSVLAQCTSSGARSCDGTNVYPRATQVGLFRIWRAGIGTSTFDDVYLVNNHFSSGPQNRVLQRTEQAAFTAAVADAILDANADAKILLGGDLNVYPRPDDPYAPGQTISGSWTGPSDQLAALYESPLVNLYDIVLDEHPEAAYTYNFQGQAQTIDHLWMSPALLEDLVRAAPVHVNADYPADAFGSGEEPAYGRWGVSDHDPETALVDIAVSVDGLIALIDHLYATGRLDYAPAAMLKSQLGLFELTGSKALLKAIDKQLTAWRKAGLVDADVADGLKGEIAQLEAAKKPKKDKKK
jgi:predicted extracellular nuclease